MDLDLDCCDLQNEHIMLWFEWEMAPIHLSRWPPDSQLVLLFGEVKEALGGGALLEGHTLGMQDLRASSPAPFSVCSFLCVNKMGWACFLLLAARLYPHYRLSLWILEPSKLFHKLPLVMYFITAQNQPSQASSFISLPSQTCIKHSVLCARPHHRSYQH